MKCEIIWKIKKPKMKDIKIKLMAATIISAFALQNLAWERPAQGLPLACAYLGAEHNNHTRLGTLRDKFNGEKLGSLRPQAAGDKSRVSQNRTSAQTRAAVEHTPGSEGRPKAAGGEMAKAK